MAAWQEQLNALKERYAQLSFQMRMVLFGGLAIVVAAGALLSVHSEPTPDALLFSGLTQEDIGEISERLRSMHVPFELGPGGGSILVPEERVLDLRLSLATENLPSGGSTGFELFDEQRFGESEFTEQINYHRALEGELARTINHLSGVESGRVHLVLPQRTLFANNEQGASASVVLHFKPGRTMSPEQVSGIVHLVASSVRGLSPESVTVVDSRGNRLSGHGEKSGQTSADALDFTRRIEGEKASAAQTLLDATLGAGRSKVSVAADVSFAHEEQTEESFDPERVAARSFQIEEERDQNATRTAQGVPGAVSNLAGAPAEQGTSMQALVRRNETRNFEVSKIVKHSVAPIGRLQRLTVAAVVDGTWKGEGEKATFQKRSAEELKQLKALVANAVGADLSRGDEVTLECVPMPRIDTADFETDVVDPFGPLKPYRPVLPYGAGLIALIVLAVVLLIRRRRQPEAAPTPVQVREIEAEGLPALPTTEELALAANAGRETELRLLSAEFAENDPETAARIVRGWIAEDVR